MRCEIRRAHQRRGRRAHLDHGHRLGQRHDFRHTRERSVEDIGLKLGDAVTIQTGDVKDWLFTDGQSMTGGFSVATLRNAAGKRELFTTDSP